MVDLKAIAEALGNPDKTESGYFCKCPKHESGNKDSPLYIYTDKDGNFDCICGEKCNPEELKSYIFSIAKELKINITPVKTVKEKKVKKEVIEQKSKKRKATRQEYYELFESVLNYPRKCIFAEKLMTFDNHSHLWNPAINYLDILKSEALLMSETQDIKFELTHFKPHFSAFESSKEAKLLVNIPKWDGRSRISEMAYLMKLKEKSGVKEEDFSELLKEWMARMFQRLYDPMIQNHILILQGAQGAGKDTWISMLLDGLGQFAVPFNVTRDDKDMYLKLHRGLVMKISEFDRTAKAEVATLKDIITTPSTDIRAPYDADSKIRASRCSFISSANIENLLRDYTGNRRYMIFEVESIEYAYEKWSKKEQFEWQKQCLAEAKVLAKENYRARPECRNAMKNYIETNTPDNPGEHIYSEFEDLAFMHAQTTGIEVLTEKHVRPLITELAKNNRMNKNDLIFFLRKKCGKCVTDKESGSRVWIYTVSKAH